MQRLTANTKDKVENKTALVIKLLPFPASGTMSEKVWCARTRHLFTYS